MPDTVIQTDNPDHGVVVQGPRQRSAQWGDLMTALAKAQGEIEGAKKDSQNPHFKSSYADLASVWTAIREPLSKNGLAITQWPRVVNGAVEVETIIAHGEQFVSDVLWMPCAKMDAHGIGSATTYARRYALMAVAGVAPEDDDGAGAVDRSNVAGSAGGGQDFRPPGPRKFTGRSWADDEPQLVNHTREKGKLSPKAEAHPLGGVEATAENARKLKIKTGADKRIEALKAAPFWTSDGLDQFYRDNLTWIEWMGDPANKADEDYERFLKAFEDAKVNVRPVELA